MATNRLVAPLVASSGPLFSRVASSTVFCPKPCPHVLRTFSSLQRRQSNAQRKMQTSTYQAHSLHPPPPPPPRNTGTPETSIASATPETRSPSEAGHYNSSTSTPPAQQATTSINEQEAQRSTPTAVGGRTQAKSRLKTTCTKSCNDADASCGRAT